MTAETTLAPCPCGKVPTRLIVQPIQGGSATVTGNCCSKWLIEFYRDGARVRTETCNQLALKAWNNAPRSAQNAE